MAAALPAPNGPRRGPNGGATRSANCCARSAGSEIVRTVQHVNDMMGEISAATSEQSAGIGPANESAAQRDQMTHPNAARVEESAAAAQSLREQAEQLARTVPVFTLRSMPGKAGAALPPPSSRDACRRLTG